MSYVSATYRNAQRICLLSVVTVLAACGGGGGGSSEEAASAQAAQPGTAQYKSCGVTSTTFSCSANALVTSRDFTAENSVADADAGNGWTQCIGVNSDGDGTSAQWTWSWPGTGTQPRAFPQVVYGQKPGYQTTVARLPRALSAIAQATIAYDVSSTHDGAGNLSFDLWLTNTQDPVSASAPPVTQQIAIWIDTWGALQPAGRALDRATIGGQSYDVLIDDRVSQAWPYITFRSVNPQVGAGSLDLRAFFSYLRAKKLIAGTEYLSSIGFGSQIAAGSGETLVNAYSVTLN